MGKFSGMLLASDYDGTLASSDGTISEINRKAIRYFTAEGGFFTVCTGRSKQGFHAFDKELMNAPVIVANGGMLYDYKLSRTVAVVAVDQTHISILKGISENFPYVCFEMYSDKNNTFAFNLCEESRRHFERQYIAYEVVDSFEKVEFPIVKLMLYVGRENTAEVQKYLSECDLIDLKYIPSDGDFIELLHKDTDKGKALLRLADALGVSRDSAFAVGDGSNDVDMLRAASVGFVPENGDVFAKNAGDIIVKSNDNDAVADTIRKIEEMFCQKGK